MSIDPAYIKSAIETLELIQHLYNHLKENQKDNELPNFLSQIESKGDARVQSSLGQTLGIDIPVADQEGKPTKFWEGVRDMAKLAHKQWLALKNPIKFIQFLGDTRGSLSTRIAPEEKPISPLEEMLRTEAPIKEEIQPTSPLEEMLTEPVPTPEPTPIVEPVPTPEPTPVVEPVPTPEPSIPRVPPPPDKFQALDEALKTSGLDQPTEEISEPSPSLTSMLLQKDETTEKEEDDMLSLSLREALKILRDEDED